MNITEDLSPTPSIPMDNVTCISNCSESSCSKDGSQSLTVISRNFLCSEQSQTIVTANFLISNVNMSATMSNNCLEIELFSTSIQLYTKPLTESIAMTFVQPPSENMSNIYSVVQNRHGVTVGQILSDILSLNVTVLPTLSDNPTAFESLIFMDMCVFCNNVQTCGGIDDEEVDSNFTVFDLGSPILNWLFRANECNSHV